MIQYLPHIMIPMIVSNVAHMVFVKKNSLPRFTIPISTPLFGANKTWRGFFIVGLLNGICLWLINLLFPLFAHLEAVIIGLFLGLSYMIFELPNSFLKRRLGIASGQIPPKNAGWFMLLDKCDSTLGVAIISKFLFDFSWLETVELFLIGVVIHVFFSWLLVVLNIKKRF